MSQTISSLRMLSLLFLSVALAACAPGAAPSSPTATAEAQRAVQSAAAQQLAGVLRQINGNLLTIENQSGTVSANLAANATILKQSVVILQDLKAGEQVTFTGQRDSSGDMIASLVRATPPGLEELLMPFAITAGDSPISAEGRQAPPEVRQQIGRRPQGQVPEEVLQRLQAQPQGGAVGRNPNDLTITGPIEGTQANAIVVTSGSVTYTVRLAENGQVIRVAPASQADLQTGSRVQCRGEQSDGRWTLTFVLAVGDMLGVERSP